MRLSPASTALIRRIVTEQAGSDARVRLFGSRLDDARRGGDIDLLVELDHPVAHPAQLSADIAARCSRRLQGRKVDVVISAPNLSELPIHTHARSRGVLL